MRALIKTFALSSVAIAMAGCSDSSSVNNPPPVPATAIVSFSVSDAPVDFANQVVVSYAAISLRHSDGTTYDLPVNGEDGNETVAKVDLLNYQDGESRLIISNVELPVGDYTDFTLHTYECAQNHNGSAEHCYVEDLEGIKPLKTPSNKLRLGDFSVSSDGVQAYTIEFNLRQSMTMTAGGAGYNLKPHGVRILDNSTVSSLFGKVEPSLFTAGVGCEDNSDHQTSFVYLYEAPLAEDAILGDEFDPAVDTEAPEDVVAPIASTGVKEDGENGYGYHFGFIAPGDYVVAFSCSADGDMDPEKYEGVAIANPETERANVTLQNSLGTEQNFPVAQ
ncbi:DUF4382 domain-containing protein [Paraferrimonas sedimenticola]|uniref:DUF4382 domain-containing protein n=1 Tax=Paraferrimonas sedimenticola TaxID=375674 RepID=A0AA37W0L3_9GAMM|nr:DUF4382 domain-containing protein [Paraferrimonas sedimenticola]GLP95172.1 hypothetical protein GCM10007895_04780 [Paraferrimonas sedimenticola]